MFNNFGFVCSKILKEAEKERFDLHHPYVGSEHLLLAILHSDTELKDKLKEYDLTYQKFRDELVNIVGIPKKNIEANFYTPLLKRILSNALNDAKENNKGNVTVNHLLIAMLDEGEGIAIRIMIGLDIDIDALYDELKVRPKDLLNSKLEIMSVGEVLNEKVDTFDKVIGRDKEINSLIEILLRKNKSNPLLIGPAGVGKTAIVEELARRIKNKEVPSLLSDKIIVSLPMGDLVSGTKYRGEFEERLTKIIKEVVKNKNIILFIDEVHTMVNAGGAEGAINASDILKPYLARGDIKVIGATTTKEFENFIRKDKALERRFTLINVNEPNVEETTNIIKGLKSSFEDYYKLSISSDNIDDIVYFSNRYLYGRKNPDKTLDLLDSVCAYVKRTHTDYNSKDISLKLEALRTEKEKFVKNGEFDKALENCQKIDELVKAKRKKQPNQDITKKDILAVTEKLSNIPMFLDKKELIRNIKQELDKKIYSETSAKNKIVKCLENYFKNEKNLKVMLLGPSGVGKTSSVKIISEVLNNTLIRLDMSEYNLETSIGKLIGVSHGYVGYDDDYIFNKVKYNPYSIILVDEIEKAHPSILNLFLTIMDEGYVTDAHGEVIDFSHTLIFMTSNAIKNIPVGFLNHDHNLNENFSEEFLGRFDDIIYFDTLTKDDVIRYLKDNIPDYHDYEEILKEINYRKYGFRNIKRIVNKYKCLT